MKDKRGLFLAIEGLDRCGKTTQVQLLVDWFHERGERVETLKFPNRSGQIGQILDAYLRGTESLSDEAAHLLFSADRWQSREAIVQTVSSGRNLIVDRYAYSGVAFTSAKGIDISWCRHPDVGLPKPDLVLYLDVNPNKLSQRMDYGGEIYERVEFQKVVYEKFMQLKESNWAVIKANQSISDVHNEIIKLVLPLLNAENIVEPLDRLWMSESSSS